MPKNEIQIRHFELFSNNMRRSLALHVHPQEVRITNLRIHSFIKIDQRVFEALEYRQMFFILGFQFYFAKKKIDL